MIPTLYETGLGREPRDKTSVFKEERVKVTLGLVQSQSKIVLHQLLTKQPFKEQSGFQLFSHWD